MTKEDYGIFEIRDTCKDQLKVNFHWIFKDIVPRIILVLKIYANENFQIIFKMGWFNYHNVAN